MRFNFPIWLTEENQKDQKKRLCKLALLTYKHFGDNLLIKLPQKFIN